MISVLHVLTINVVTRYYCINTYRGHASEETTLLVYKSTEFCKYI